MIRKQGSKYVVKSSSGRTLGTHTTRKAAVAQLRAVEASKHKEERGHKEGRRHKEERGSRRRK